MKYEIWQLKENWKENLFKSWDDIDYEGQFYKEHYQKMYEGDYKANIGNVVGGFIYSVLDRLFEIFNIHKPIDFKGHSLSVSDVVVVNCRAFYCDEYGWKEVDFEEVTMDSIYADEELAQIEKDYKKAYGEE